MATSYGLSALLRLVALTQLARSVTCISLTVATSGGNASSPTLYGLMFEDINHSGDGGIHGQLLRNNGFQGDDQTLTAYAAVGDVDLAVDSDNPLTTAIPYSLSVTVPEGTTGDVGFSNEGYWGVPVNADTYQSYFWMKGDYSGTVTLKLVGNYSGIEYASQAVTVTSTTDEYTYYDTSFVSDQAPDGDNLWTLTFDGETAAGSTLYFDLVQLFPTTFNTRFNGLKPTLANVLNDVGSTFLRFPGGNNLEGATEEDRWKWNETVGPVEDRPGRQGDWGYPNTDALGLIEYMLWCEDMGLTPVLAVWDGFALESGGNTPFTGDALTPYVDDVLDELEFLLGDSSTTYGALRASYGYTDPFSVSYVEVGNEDNLGGGCDSYPERFQAFYDAITAAWPSITLIASTSDTTCLPDPLPAGIWTDYHNYATQEVLVAGFSEFDNTDRTFPLLIGEFSYDDGNLYPTLSGSVAESIYMMGFERNSDVVKMSAYAPTLQLFNSTQWTPDLIGFSQNPGGVVRSTSYFVQQMFASNWGDTVMSVTSDTAFGPVYWSASSSSSAGAYYVKLANYGSTTETVSVAIDGMTAGTLTTLTGDEDAYNSAESGEIITPVTSTPDVSDGVFTIDMPAWSVVVLVAT